VVAPLADAAPLAEVEPLPEVPTPDAPLAPPEVAPAVAWLPVPPTLVPLPEPPAVPLATLAPLAVDPVVAEADVPVDPTPLVALAPVPAPGPVVDEQPPRAKAAAIMATQALPLRRIRRRTVMTIQYHGPTWLGTLPGQSLRHHVDHQHMQSLRALVMKDLYRAVLAAVLLSAVPAGADDGPAYGPQLEGYAYPWAYVDVQPKTPNGRTIVLLHGKNFCAATWQGSVAALTADGYRVIAPDQIGFCKSTKPAHYQYSFQQLAANTHALLARLGVSKATIMGHSTGGMLGIRYALMYPQDTDQLVLVDPIGLEDWKAKGVPWQSVDAWYQRELNTTAARIRDYERTTYYAGTWKPEYEPWVEMLAGLYRGPGREIVAWNSALLYDMIFTQPVFYELDRIEVPVLLLIGDKDTTAIGKELAPPEIRVTLGNYSALGKAAAARIPHAHLVEFPELGHAPQIQAPAAFHKALLDGLRGAGQMTGDGGK
jgi:pimeloyl-ACP methyl ester carboxylesterase